MKLLNSSDSVDYKRLISLLLGSYHAQMTERIVEYEDEDKIAKTADRIGRYLEIREQCLKSSVTQVGGARMSDNNTPGIPEKKDITFKIVDKKSLGHVHSIIFWNYQQVGCKGKRIKKVIIPIQLCFIFFS